jgi:cobalt-precorrin 5A hydrolase
MEKTAILAITKNGIKIASTIKEIFPTWEIFAPAKFADDTDANWYDESTTAKIAELYKNNDAVICIFSLGAVIRLIAPHLRDKKTDPAVIVIDDKANFVISTLSGHLGGANEIANEIAKKLGSTAVITTAADVNKTISVDLVGRKFGWSIDDDSTVTKISAFMVNEEKIGVYQDAGERNWWEGDLPKNVTVYDTFEKLEKSDSRGFLIITDKTIVSEILKNAVVYRPKTLVIGVGLHGDTTKEKILEGLNACLEKFNLSPKAIARFTSIKKLQDINSLIEVAKEFGASVEYFERGDLAKVRIPNPSVMVEAFEGTASVSEASSILSSKGSLVVEKQKFPPDLTIAIARIEK